ncbi:MAG: BLUF domain-containing protein [Pricia sp.]
MLRIEEKGPIEQLRMLSVRLGGDFHEGRNAAFLRIDNANATGRVFAYEMLPGLSMRSYDITFKKEVSFRTGGGTDAPIFMIYCLKGHYFHEFAERDDSQKVSRGQNLILSPKDNELGSINFPPDVVLEISIIVIERSKINGEKKDRQSSLDYILRDLFLKVKPNGYFKDFGGHESKVADHAKVLIQNKRTDVIGRLITEAAILNTMAAQLDSQDKREKAELEPAPLVEGEMQRILSAVSNMQSNVHKHHTIKLFSKRVGLSPKKIQEGFRYLFGRSFANFLKDVRLELARELLETTDLPISQIATNVGIASKSHISRIFKERFGLPPRDYRASLTNSLRSFELTYRSKASMFIGESDVTAIVETSNIKNLENGLTGCLIYYKDYFFQVLEGPKKKVLKTFEAIRQDSRHQHVETLYKGLRNRRIFTQNGMILLSDKEIATKYSTGRNLSVDMKTLIADDSHKGITSKMFWERIRNRILTSEVA